MTTTMSSQLAICCGPTVITWNCRTDVRGDNTSKIQPHGDRTSVTDVSWNDNGQGKLEARVPCTLYCTWNESKLLPSRTTRTFAHLSVLFLLLVVLASCSGLGNDDDNVVLTSTVSHGTLESFRHDRGLKRPSPSGQECVHAAATCISFGGKSRYLTVGDASGAVCLWDLKKKTRVRHYFHSATSSLQATVDPTNAHVLSLTQNALHVFRLREGTLAARLSGTSRYTHFSASVLEPSKVAIGTETGTVDVWDLSSQSKVGSLSPHTGAVTGVAFSPVSKLLLASASVDQALVFSDAAAGTVIQRMELGSPASCLTFHDDGLTCAVGTESKCVLVYDLRQPNDAMATYQANDVVTCLSFAPGGTASNGRTKSKSRQATLSPEKPTSNCPEQKAEFGRVVASVLDGSRDSMVTTSMPERAANEPHNVSISAWLDKVRNGNECKRSKFTLIPS